MNRSAPDYTAMHAAAMRRSSAASGHYHRNVRMDQGGDSFMVRVPKDDPQVMDLSLWPEDRILLALDPAVSHVPRLIHVQHEPYFQVQGFIEGALLEDLYPRGTTIPKDVADDVTQLFADLLSFPAERVPEVPPEWPVDGDSRGFAELLIRFGRRLRAYQGERTPSLFRELRIPEDPFRELEDRISSLTARPFRLLHGDIHRGNMIKAAKQTYFLDWQLALWGDPVYDLADHVHKMVYPSADAERAVGDWAAVAPAPCGRGLLQDLDFYLGYERVKSAVVDTVRWSHRIAETPERSRERAAAVQQLTEKINRARPYWGAGFHAPLEPRAVAEAVATYGP